MHDVRWSEVAGDTRVLYEADWDGHDLVFLSWGTRAAEISNGLQGVLENLRPEG